MIFSIYILLTLIFTFPAIFHLSDKITGDGGDNYQFLSFQYLASKQFKAGQFPFGWTNYWRYPFGFDFSFSYDSTLFILLGVLFYMVIDKPVIIYNLSIFILLFLNCVLAYLFFNKIVHNRLLGFTGGLIYGFSFFSLAKTGGHPNLILTSVIPFFVYSIILLSENWGKMYSFIIFTISLILIFLTSLQYWLFFLAFLLISVPIFFIFYKRKALIFLSLIKSRKKEFFVSFITTVFIFLYINYGWITAFINHSLILPKYGEIVSVPLVNYIIPNSYLSTLSSVFVNETLNWIENVVFLGYVEMLLFLLFLFSNNKIKTKIYLCLNIIIYFLLAMGNKQDSFTFLPYSFLFNIFPFKGINEPSRFYIITYLFLTLGILLYLKSIIKKVPRVVIYILITLLIIERFPKNFHLSDTLYDRDFITAVKKTDSQAILDLPVFIAWQGNIYDLYSVYYQKPIVNGYIHWAGNTEAAIKFIKNRLTRFSCESYPSFDMEQKTLNNEDILLEKKANEWLLVDLRIYNIRTIVIHKDIIDVLKDMKVCQNVVQRINILLGQKNNHLIKIFENSRKEIYFLQ